MTIILQTQRLIVKAIEACDLEHLINLRSDPLVMKYVGNGVPQSIDEVEHFLKAAIDYQDRYGFSFFCVFEKDSGAFIGQAGLFHLGFSRQEEDIEIAYRLHQKFWGQGYATELASALIAWGFEHLRVNKLVAFVHLENLASRRVLEKAGMVYIGQMKYQNKDVFGFEIYKSDSIELVPYNTQWPKMAEAEIKNLQEALPKKHILDMQHVGSTAILGMHSKPIIDIQIAVDSLETVKQTAIDALKNLDYQYWAENPEPERLFFVKNMPPFGEKRTHHIHIYEPTSHHWQEKIRFRDYLLAHPDTALAYQNLKMELAALYKYDREKYTQAKTKFIHEVLNKCDIA